MSTKNTQLMSLARQLDRFGSRLSWSEKRRKKETQRRFDAECRRAVNAVVDEDPTPGMARGFLNREISNLINVNPALERPLMTVRRGMMRALGEDDDDDRAPPRSTLASLLLYTALFMALFFGVLHFWGPAAVVSPRNTPQGIVERARAFDRVVMYNGLHREGDGVLATAANFILSPVAPTEDESKGAQAFEAMTMSAYRDLRPGRDVCGDPLDDESRMAMISAVSAHVRGKDVAWNDRPARTLREPIKAFRPCSRD